MPVAIEHSNSTNIQEEAVTTTTKNKKNTDRKEASSFAPVSPGAGQEGGGVRVVGEVFGTVVSGDRGPASLLSSTEASRVAVEATNQNDEEEFSGFASPSSAPDAKEGDGRTWVGEVVSGDRGRPSLPCSKAASSLVAVEGTDHQHHLEKKDQDRNEESSFAFLSAVAQAGNGMSWVVGEVGSDEASGDRDLPLPSSAEGAERNRTAAVLSSLPVAATFEVVPSLTLLATLGMLV